MILNWFRAKKQFSSGVVEGFNNKAKLTTKKASGFKTFHMLEIALYLTLGDLPEGYPLAWLNANGGADRLQILTRW